MLGALAQACHPRLVLGKPLDPSQGRVAAQSQVGVPALRRFDVPRLDTCCFFASSSPVALPILSRGLLQSELVILFP